MTQTDLAAAKPIRNRVHRMMRRAEAERRRRDHKQRADLLGIELDCLPFWRHRRRTDIEDQIARHRELARVYGEFLGVEGVG